MEKIQMLPGMRDLYEGPLSERKLTQDLLQDHLSLYGYRVLDPPIIEPTELFLRKSGGELAARMYTFTDTGDKLISLRPEFTSSIVRHFLDKDSNMAVPQRVQYSGPVFRRDGIGVGCHQFTQVGAELWGALGPLADAEIITMAMGVLSVMQIKGCDLIIGDLSVLRGALELCHLSEHAMAFVIANIPDLKEGPEGLARVWDKAHTLQITNADRQHTDLAQAMEGLNEEKSRNLLQNLLRWANPDQPQIGQRDPDEIVARLLQKAQGVDEASHVWKGLEIVCKLACINGEPEIALDQARELVRSYGGDETILHPLEHLLQLIQGDISNDVNVTLNFGLVRDMAYYTGTIFEVKPPSRTTAIGGGGRYDGLAKALGSVTDIPALGFAYTLESLLEASSRESHVVQEQFRPQQAFVWAGNLTGQKMALALASELRDKGIQTAVDVNGRSLKEAISYARGLGYPTVTAVDESGTVTQHTG
jgi:histidyl-tRNA synthetase